MRLKSLVITLAMVLIPMGISWSQPIEEPPVNIQGITAMRDVRQADACIPAGLSPANAEYFHLDVMIYLKPENPFLDKLKRVKRVVANHDSGKSYELYKVADSCEQWLGVPCHQYYLMLLPESWMFSGTWTFEMIYNGNDGNKRLQRRLMNMIPEAGRPGRITGAKIQKDASGEIIATWDAIGTPLPPGPMMTNFDYRVRLYDQSIDIGCPVAELKTEEWGGTGWYDSLSNTVSFVIPPEYSGKPVRFETRINTSVPPDFNFHRSCYTTVAPW